MYAIKKMFLNRKKVYQEWEALLINANIRRESNVSSTYGIYDEDCLIATGSIYQNILKCIAISNEYRGGNIIGQLITRLMDEVWQEGYQSCYVYTKADAVDSFVHLGFKEIARVGSELVFLEKAIHGFDEYCFELEKQKREGKVISAIVMNANPFTKGHQYLIEFASKESDWVYVFVLSEDISEFPTKVRKDLVEKGVAHLKNVIVLETGHYMISSQTFPSYFLKEDSDLTRVQAELDATIFAERIAGILGISRRYVGEEPFSIATAIYNEVLSEKLYPNISLVTIKRKEINSNIISATTVRKLLIEDKWEEVQAYVPKTTYEYLLTDTGREQIHHFRKGGKEIDKV